MLSKYIKGSKVRFMYEGQTKEGIIEGISILGCSLDASAPKSYLIVSYDEECVYDGVSEKAIYRKLSDDNDNIIRGKLILKQPSNQLAIKYKGFNYIDLSINTIAEVKIIGISDWISLDMIDCSTFVDSYIMAKLR